MSKFPGGIFSKASGQVSGLVFSQARTRQGKLMTARQLVIPTNPKTFAQQNNRYAQRIATQMVTTLGPGIYRTDWDEAEGLNAGYASLLSIIRQNYKAWNVVDPDFAARFEAAPQTTQLGDLHFPDTVTGDSPSNGVIDLTWSTENGSNGSPTDTAVAVIIQSAYTTTIQGRQLLDLSTAVPRSAGGVQLSVGQFVATGLGAMVLLYFRSGLPDPSNLSPASWFFQS